MFFIFVIYFYTLLCELLTQAYWKIYDENVTALIKELVNKDITEGSMSCYLIECLVLKLKGLKSIKLYGCLMAKKVFK